MANICVRTVVASWSDTHEPAWTVYVLIGDYCNESEPNYGRANHNRQGPEAVLRARAT